MGRQAPSAQFSKTKMCKFELLGMCTKGWQCPFAHGSDELRPLPDLRRTKMCRELLHSGACSHPGCAYAHSREELRATMQWPSTARRARRVRATQTHRGAHAGCDAEVTGPDVASERGDQAGNSNAIAWREAEAMHNVCFPASETPIYDWSTFKSAVSGVHGMPYLSQEVSGLGPLSLKAAGDPAYVSLQPAFTSPNTMGASVMEPPNFLTGGLGSPVSTRSEVSSNHASGAHSQDISSRTEGSEDGRPGDVDWEEMCVGLSLMAHVSL